MPSLISVQPKPIGISTEIQIETQTEIQIEIQTETQTKTLKFTLGKLIKRPRDVIK